MFTTLENQLGTAVFMKEGLRDYCDSLPLGPDPDETGYALLLNKWDGGATGLINEMVKYVPIAYKILDAAYAPITAYRNDVAGGVFDYDVSNAFGSWWALQAYTLPGAGQLPEHLDCVQMLRGLIYDYVTQAAASDPSSLPAGWKEQVKAAIDAVEV